VLLFLCARSVTLGELLLTSAEEALQPHCKRIVPGRELTSGRIRTGAARPQAFRLAR
jgi:hypothetical protein